MMNGKTVRQILEVLALFRVKHASVLSLTLRYNESLHFDQMDIGKAFQ